MYGTCNRVGCPHTFNLLCTCRDVHIKLVTNEFGGESSSWHVRGGEDGFYNPANASNNYLSNNYTGSAGTHTEFGLYAADPNSASVTAVDTSNLLGLMGPSGASDRTYFGQKSTMSFPAKLLDDQLNFYSHDSLLLMGFGLGTGAACQHYLGWRHSTALTVVFASCQ